MSNIKNRTIYCKDNLDILRNIDDESVDMIYLDPPFNKNKSFHAPVGTNASGASFKDIFGSDDIDPRWMEVWKSERPELYSFIKSMYFFADLSDASYIQYMAVRVIECRRILKETGTIWYHCDHTMNDYVKIMLDIVFGRNHDINNIVWCYKSGGASKKSFSKKHDNLFFYAKTKNYKYNSIKEKSYYENRDRKIGPKGEILEKDEKGAYILTLPKDYWDINIIGVTSSERTGYPTQKPLELLDKIIQCSTDEGDIILDPFCGCATACVSAENNNRQWIGIDISIKAFELVKERLGATTGNLFANKVQMTLETEAPVRSEYRTEEKKWVYIVSNQAYPGEYKVGIATNPKARLSSYQTSDPNMGYKMEFKVEVPNWLEIEKAVHNHFPNKREWVQAELKEIKEYINTLQNK